MIELGYNTPDEKQANDLFDRIEAGEFDAKPDAEKQAALDQLKRFQIAQQYKREEAEREDIMAGYDSIDSVPWTPEDDAVSNELGTYVPDDKARRQNTRWLAHEWAMPEEMVSENMDLLRPKMAEGLGIKNPELATDLQIYDALSARRKSEKEEEATYLAVMDRGIAAAIDGDPTQDFDTALSKSLGEGEEISPERKRQFAQIYGEVQAMMTEHREVMEMLRDVAGKQTGLKKDAKTEKTLGDLADAFSTMNESDQDKALSFVVAYYRSQGKDKNFLYQLGESIGRGGGAMYSHTRGMFDEAKLEGIEQALKTTTPLYWKAGDDTSIIHERELKDRYTGEIPEGYTLVPVEHYQEALNGVRRLKTANQVKRKLRKIIESDIDPIKVLSKNAALRWLEQGAYDAAGSIPYMVAAAVPYVGWAYTTSAMVADKYDDLRLRYPDMPIWQAQLISTAVGIPQGVIEKISAEQIISRIPGVRNFLTSAGDPAAWRNFGKRWFEQWSEEMAQEGISIVFEGLSATMGAAMPDWNWMDQMRGLPGTAGQNAAATLFFALPGRYRSPKHGEGTLFRNVLDSGNRDQLAKFGYSEEQIDAIVATPRGNSRDAVAAEEWARRPENLAQQAYERAEAEVKAEATIHQRAADAGEEVPVPVKVGEKFGLRHPDGNVSKYDTAEEMVAALQRMEISRLRGDAPINTALHQFFSERTENVEWKKLDVAKDLNEFVKEGLASPEQIQARIDVAGIGVGQLAEVDGYTQSEIRDGVLKHTIALVGDADPDVIVEEVGHTAYRNALARGQITFDQFRDAVQAYGRRVKEFNLDEPGLTEETIRTRVDEGIADMVKATFFGRLREIDQLQPGLRAFFLKLARMLKEIFRRAFVVKQMVKSGEIGPEIQTFLSQAAGLEAPPSVTEAAFNEVEYLRGTGALPTAFSIRATVAPTRVDELAKLTAGERKKRTDSAKFKHLQQIVDDVAEALNVKITARWPTVGGWSEQIEKDPETGEIVSGGLSLEVPEVIEFDTEDWDLAMDAAVLLGATAPDLQNGVFLWEDNPNGQSDMYSFQAKSADAAKEVAMYMHKSGQKGFSYDIATRTFSIAVKDPELENLDLLYEYIEEQTSIGNIAGGKAAAGAGGREEARGRLSRSRGKAEFAEEAAYGSRLREIRDNNRYTSKKANQVISRAERRLTRNERAKQTAEKAKEQLAAMRPPLSSAAVIEKEIGKRKFENIRELGLFLDQRFKKRTRVSQYEVGSHIDDAAKSLEADVLDGLAGNGSGEGWYNERVQETLHEIAKIYPELESDQNAMAVFIGILASTSQGYTVVENFKQAETVYDAYKKTGRMPQNVAFAQSHEAIKDNLDLIQQIIDNVGLDGYREFMESEVTGAQLRDQFGKAPTGVTLVDKVRGNRVLGPKIGSFFNNLRGRFDTITKDLWFTRSMHRYVGETLVPLNNGTVQKNLKAFRVEMRKPGVRDYQVPKEWLKTDEGTIRAANQVYARWGAGKGGYTDKTYFMFEAEKNKKAVTIEKLARRVHNSAGMKGAPKNKKTGQWFEAILRKAQASLQKKGFGLTEADIQAIVWFREKRLFGKVGVASEAAKPADYLDAVMVMRQRRAAAERTGANVAFSIRPKAGSRVAFEPDIDRLAWEIQRYNPNPEEKLEVQARALTRLRELQNLIKYREATANPELASLQTTASLAVMVAAMPPEVRGKFPPSLFTALQEKKRAGTRTAKLIELADKLDGLLEAHLRQEYTSRIEDVFEASKAKDKKTGAGLASDYVNDALEAWKRAKPEESQAELAKLDEILRGENKEIPATTENILHYGRKHALERLYGGHRGMSAERLADAWKTLKGTREAGMAAWRESEEKRREQNKAMAEQAVKEIGVEPGRGAETRSLEQEDRIKRNLSGFVRGHYTLGQLLEVTFGTNSNLTKRFKKKLAKASGAAEDSRAAAGKRMHAAIGAAIGAEGVTAELRIIREIGKLRERKDHGFTYQKGRKVENVRIPIPEAQAAVAGNAQGYTVAELEQLQDGLDMLEPGTRVRTIEIERELDPGKTTDYGPVSLDEMVYAVMTWDQEDGRRLLERQGVSSETIEAMRRLVFESKSAVATLRFLRDEYQKGHKPIDTVYRRMYGMPLPQIRNYSPLRVQMRGDESDLNVDGGYNAGGMSPGSLHSRVMHARPIDLHASAMGTFISHTISMSHWIAFAETIREMRAVMSDNDVMEAISVKYGEQAAQNLQQMIGIVGQDGVRTSAGASLAERAVGKFYSSAAISILGGSLRTVMMQSDNLMRVLLALPKPQQFMRAISLTLQDPGSVKKIWDSPTIQRRLENGFSPEVRAAMAKAQASPSTLLYLAGRGMLPMQYYDAAGMALTGTFVYQYHKDQFLKKGLTEAAAEQLALEEMDMAVATYGQPSTVSQRSRFEFQGTFAKVLFMFATDARAKAGIYMRAWGDVVRGENVAENVWRIVWMNSLFMAGEALRDLWGLFTADDDDEVFEWEDYVRALVLGPGSGLFLAGAGLELITNAMTGGWIFDRSENPMKRVASDAVKIVTHPEKLVDPESAGKSWRAAFTAVAQASAMVGAPRAAMFTAGAAELTRVLSDAIDIANREGRE